MTDCFVGMADDGKIELQLQKMFIEKGCTLATAESCTGGAIASRFTANPCNGTYFQLLNYSKISNLPDVEMAENLTTKNGVASIPISVFSAKINDEKNLRFCFAKTDETLKKAGDILIKI